MCHMFCYLLTLKQDGYIYLISCDLIVFVLIDSSLIYDLQIRQSWFGTKDLRKTAQFLTVTQFKRLTFILCIQKRGFEYISTTSTDERMQFNNPYPPPYYQVLQLFHFIQCSSTTLYQIPKMIGLSQKITPITTFCARFSDQKM